MGDNLVRLQVEARRYRVVVPVEGNALKVRVEAYDSRGEQQSVRAAGAGEYVFERNDEAPGNHSFDVKLVDLETGEPIESRRVVIEVQPGEQPPPWPRMIVEAASDARNTVELRHLLGALSRTWLVGNVYFEIDAQKYIQTLCALRERLSVPERPLGATRKIGVPSLSPEVEAILAVRDTREPGVRGELAMLGAMAAQSSSRLSASLKELSRGPSDVRGLFEGAKTWVEVQADREPQALVRPDGVFERSRFVPGAKSLLQGELGVGSTEPVGCWDLLVALFFLEEGVTRTAWINQGSRKPEPSRWHWGQELTFDALSPDAREVITEVMDKLPPSGCLSERILLRGLVSADALDWERLTPQARTAMAVDDCEWSKLRKCLSAATF